ncbi:PAS domain-containing sensor histidine kinase [Gemmatimonadota bacterium]
MFRIKSFQRRILLALLGVGLVPAALILVAGTLALSWVVGSAGTAGPWTSVAESGQVLFEALAEAEVTEPDVAAAARTHQEDLSESLTRSRILAVVGDRILALLPLVAIVLALFIAGLSFWAARQLSRGFSRPIRDLVGWTDLIAREEPLPPPGQADTRGVQEFTLLREALRTMEGELKEGRRQAEQAAKLRSWTDMARRVAHEIKNPLTPMGMAAATVSRLEGDAAQEAGAVLLEEIARLDEMARTFSQFGKMPEGPPSEVDLVELLQGLVGQHAGTLAVLDFQPATPLPLITGHYDALLRSFRNLLLNAVDASGPQGEVHIRAWREGSTLGVEVRDSGPGIPEENLDLIWEPDFTTKSRGTGLGLPMVRQTITAHNGRILGRNHPEGGAVFLVELPLDGSPPSPPGDPA